MEMIDFDGVWKWIGFSIKQCIEEIEVNVLIHVDKQVSHGGQNKETIMLSVNFKILYESFNKKSMWILCKWKISC